MDVKSETETGKADDGGSAMSSLFNLKELSTLGGLEAGDLLAVDPHVYVKFLRHLSRTVRRDVTTKNMVFLTALSAYTPEPINLFLRGESSIGKTYNVVQTLKYFPKDDVWLLGGLSPTALVHQHGVLVDKNGEQILPFQKPGKEASREEKDAWVERLKSSRFQVELKGKILVFLEAPHIETFNMLRPILSHDAEGISYRFTDKNRKGQLQTQHVIITGWPATIFCSTKERYVEDLATRGFTLTPEMTEKKYRAANVLTAKKAAFPWLYQRDFNQMLLEGYIKMVKKQLKNLKAVDPYAVSFAENFKSKTSRSMRDFKHILNLIKVYALFHYAQRPLMIRKVKTETPSSEDSTIPVENEVEEKYIMVTRKDYDFILALWRNIQETTETSAPGHIIRFYHEVVEKTAEAAAEFTIEDLTEKWNSSFEDKKSSRTIRRWTGFLSEIGYLTSKPDPTDKRRQVYKLTRNSGNIDNYVHLQNYRPFNLETLKAWQKQAEKILTQNHFALIENMTSEQEITLEDINQKYCISKTGHCVNISLSGNKASLTEKTSKTPLKNKRPHLPDFKAVYWSEGSYGWHKCAVCGQTKLTSWQAETFKGEKVWLCEDCKEAWEKQNVS